jgi:hypothetical protein
LVIKKNGKFFAVNWQKLAKNGKNGRKWRKWAKIGENGRKLKKKL